MRWNRCIFAHSRRKHAAADPPFARARRETKRAPDAGCVRGVFGMARGLNPSIALSRRGGLQATKRPANVKVYRAWGRRVRRPFWVARCSADQIIARTALSRAL